MSTHIIAILISEKLLIKQAEDFKRKYPQNNFDDSNAETHLHDNLNYNESDQSLSQYSYGDLGSHGNVRYCFDADEIRFQLLKSTRMDKTAGAIKNADALFQFLGATLLRPTSNNPANECNLNFSVIIFPDTARRLGNQYRKIDFALLEPYYQKNCNKHEDGSDYDYITSFQKFRSYCDALYSLLEQAATNQVALYAFAS